MNASAEIKLALIARLSNSLMSESLRKQSTAENLIASIQANAPKDVPLTDQEIQEEINAVRFGR